AQAEGKDWDGFGASKLLLPNVALRHAPSCSAEVLRPGWRDPTLPKENAMPGEKILFGQALVRDDTLELLGIAVFAEGTHLIAKQDVVSGELKVHGNFPSQISRLPCWLTEGFFRYFR